MSAEPATYLDRLKLWAFYAAATTALTALSALMTRWVGAPVNVPAPPPLPVTVVIERPWDEPFVHVFPGASP